MNAENIYLRLPPWAQNWAVSMQGWRLSHRRYRGGFRQFLRDFENRGLWDQNEIIAYRDARLREFVRHCEQTVPYYKRLFREIGFSAQDLHGLRELSGVPILHKSTVQDQASSLLSVSVPLRRRAALHTCGTTGACLHLWTTSRALQEQWATWWRYRRWHGIQLGTWCGYFGGRSVVPLDQNEPPFWRYNYPGRQILFSAYHIGPRTIDHYITLLRSRQPPWLHGYPSLLALIAEHLVDRRIDLGYQVRWITTGAENLLHHQADLIATAFGVKARTHYGLAEAVANISECEYGNMHVDEDFSAVEFVPIGDGHRFKVVGTNLTNPAMPLLRYEVDDVVTLSDAPCSCGRPGRIIAHIDGRMEDYIILHTGARLGRLDHIFKDLTNIREAQIYQREIGQITLRIVRSDRYSEQDEARLLQETRQRVGNAAKIDIDYVDRIERSPNGKLRFVVSELPEADIRFGGGSATPMYGS